MLGVFTCQNSTLITDRKYYFNCMYTFCSLTTLVSRFGLKYQAAMTLRRPWWLEFWPAQTQWGHVQTVFRSNLEGYGWPSLPSCGAIIWYPFLQASCKQTSSIDTYIVSELLRGLLQYLSILLSIILFHYFLCTCHSGSFFYVLV